MKVLLTIWISALLVQEVIPSTLVRLPRNAVKKPSLVQTEYEAKYEQKGEKGNESIGKLTGKHEILHDNCADNWNSFADKCASLIKELVASLANAVSSKPGDATNLQLQIKNTFRHFDSTHNCSCLNHTGKGLSDLDLTPIFQNISISNLKPDEHEECEKCGKDEPKVKGGNEGEGSGGGSKHNNHSAGQTCDGQSDCGKSGSGSKHDDHSAGQTCDGQSDCGKSAGGSKHNEHSAGQTCDGQSDCGGSHHKKHPNRGLDEEDDSHVNPENADGSKDELTNNSRRQVHHPKFTIKIPNESKSNSDPSDGGSIYLPLGSEHAITSLPNLSEQLKSPLVAPAPSSHSEHSPVFRISSPPTPISSSSSSKSPLVSDSQLASSPDSTNDEDCEPETSPQHKGGNVETITPVSHHLEPVSVIPVNVKQPTENSGILGGENSEHLPTYQHSQPTFIVPVTEIPSVTYEGSGNGDQEPILGIPIIIKTPTGTNSGLNDGNPISSSSLSQPTVLLPGGVKQSTGNGVGGNEHSSSASPYNHHHLPTFRGPIIEKVPTGSSGSHSGDHPMSDCEDDPKSNGDSHTGHNNGGSNIEHDPASSSSDSLSGHHQHSSAATPNSHLPEAAIVIPEVINNNESGTDDCSDNEDNKNLSQSKGINNGNHGGSNGGNHEIPSSVTLVPPPVFVLPVTAEKLPHSHQGSESESHPRSSPVDSELIIEVQPLAEKIPQNHFSLTTPLPNESKDTVMSINPTENHEPLPSVIEIPVESHHSIANTNHEHSSGPDLDPINSGSNGGDHSIILTPEQSQPTENCDDSGDENQKHSSVTQPIVVAVPTECGTTPLPETTTDCDNNSDPSSSDSDPNQSKGTDNQSNGSHGTSTSGNHNSPSSTILVPNPVFVLPEKTKKTNENGGENNPHSSSMTPVFHNPQPVYVMPVINKPTENNHHGHSHETSSNPDNSEATLLVPVPDKHSGGGNSDSSVTSVPSLHIIGNADSGNEDCSSTTPVASIPSLHIIGNADSGNEDCSSTTPVAIYYAKPVTAIPVVEDSHKGMSGTSENPILTNGHNADPYSGSQQERPVIYAPSTLSNSGGESQNKHPVPSSESHQPAIPAIFLKPSPPGALIPHSDNDDNQHLSHIQPTTFQTTSAEPTTSDGHLPLVAIAKPYPVTTSHPIDTYKTVPIKQSTSPKTTETHEHDEDDEEDCCSCESCTEEEITDPKLYKENACKNLEEARKELKAIFDKIKKKLKCGRKAPQTITTR